MVGNAGENRVRSIDLFERDDEGQFVLEGERAQGPEEVCAGQHAFREPVCPADDECADFSRIALDFPDLFGEPAAGKALAVFVENQAEAALATSEQLAAFALGVRLLDRGRVDWTEATQAREILGDAGTGIGQAGFADGDDTPAQGERISPCA